MESGGVYIRLARKAFAWYGPIRTLVNAVITVVFSVTVSGILYRSVINLKEIFSMI